MQGGDNTENCEGKERKCDERKESVMKMASGKMGMISKRKEKRDGKRKGRKMRS